MRLALAQINTTVGDLDGNRDRIIAADRRGPCRRRRSRRLPRARGHRLSAGGPPAPPRVRPGRRSTLPARSPQSRDGHHGARGCAARRERPPLQRVLRLRERRDRGRLPQAAATELRRLRRGAVLRVRERRSQSSSTAAARSASPCARTCGSRALPRSRAPRRAPISSSTSPRRPSTSARTRSVRRCSRPGRATTAARSSSATPSAARTSSSSTATRSCSTGRRRRGEGAGVRGGAARGRPRRARPQARWRRRSASSTRCGSRSSSAYATTWRRTGSATSSSASPAASTRRSRPHSPRRRSARIASTACRCRPASPRRRREATRSSSPSRSASDFREIPIEDVVAALECALAASFAGRERDAAEENLQARVRGTLLMALSNKLGWLVLATGNKSELSVGYATLYGDMAGGFALLKDVYKTDVWRLARHLNERAGREVIPSSVIERAPSAELGPASSTSTRSRATRSSTRCSRHTSSSTARARSSSSRVRRRRRGPRRGAWSTARSTSAVRRRPA